MTRRTNPAAMIGLAMALSVAMPVAVWAGEHGGQEPAGQEHGGTAAVAEGSHGMVANEAGLLRDAAAALRKGQARPDLAAKLEELAKAHQ